MFAFLLPEIVIGVAYVTVEAFFLSGIVSGKYCQTAKSSPNRRAFEALMNCYAQSYLTRDTVNGDGVLWEKGEGVSQNKTTSSLIYVSDAS